MMEQELMRPDIRGRVMSAPHIDDVLMKIAGAFVHKEPVSLTAGEVRVLNDHLVMLERGN